MKNKNQYLIGISGLSFAVLILLIRFVDVQPIGPEGTRIGMSHLNLFVFQLFGVNMLWYTITDWLGVVGILTAFLFALTGFVQMVRRKSVFKVDRELLALGVLYILVISLYVLFEIVIVNYRPIIMPGSTRPEASFPSSHTMLVCVIMSSAAILISKYVKLYTLCRILQGCCWIIIGVTVAGRLISGVHWFTDIIGGVLISTTLLYSYSGILKWSRSHTR